MAEELKVLLVEDSHEDTFLLVRQLNKAGYRLICDRVDNYQALSTELDEHAWDIVLSDFTMPKLDALSALHLVRQKQPDLPFIIVSGTIGEERAVAAMKAGANDCISKDKPGRLIPAIERALKEADASRRERRLIGERQILLERFQMILDRMPIGCVVTDERLHIVHWNSAAERIFGFKFEEVRGKHPFELIVPEKEQADVAKIFVRIRGGDMSAHHLSENRTKEGRTILCEWYNTPSHKSDESFNGIISMCCDITQQRSLEDQLRQAQKMESIGRLAGGIAHDFNNILTVILGCAGQMLAGSNLASEERDACNEIHKAAGRAAQLTRQLLTFSRSQVLQPQILDLNGLVADLLKMVSRLVGEHITMHCQYSSIPAVVRADRGMIEQVIMNLMVNARDAMPEGGEIRIQTAVEKITEEYIALHPDAREGNYVCLTVSDSGCGISDQDLPRIFEPFFTTKEVGKGTGLGLATVFGIVKQHEGWIEVTSKLGRGSSIKISLPEAVEEKRHLPPLSPAENTETGTTPTLLFVEDQSDIRELMQGFLEQKGYRMLMADSGLDALRVWDENKASIDLLITDVMMPGGVNGIELVRRLRRERPDLKTIVVSGYIADALPEDLAVDFIRKPYEVHELAGAITEALETEVAESIPRELRFTQSADHPRIVLPIQIYEGE